MLNSIEVIFFSLSTISMSMMPSGTENIVILDWEFQLLLCSYSAAAISLLQVES